MPNVKSCIKSSQLSVTVPSVPPVCVTTSVRNNVMKKSITCRDSIIKRPHKCLRKSTALKNRNAVNYFNEPVKNVVNCSRSISTSSGGLVCQPVRFKSVHKHVNSSIVAKPIPSFNFSETFCTIVNVKTSFMMYGYSFKFYLHW